jgi:DNA (cytosine-5)-methyltransferase 1
MRVRTAGDDAGGIVGAISTFALNLAGLNSSAPRLVWPVSHYLSRQPGKLATNMEHQIEANSDMSGGPAVIDLFCGAGGLSQGFRQAGFDVRLGLDLDAAAITTYRHNLDGAAGVAASVEDVTGPDLLDAAGLDRVDIVIGGPSCQGFSTHGRRSGWVREDDPRNFLYKHYARLLQDLQPSLFVMENVPGLLYFDDGAFGRMVIEEFERLGYKLHHKLMLAADYGVPQLRKRLLIVGTKSHLPFQFPSPTHMGAYRRDAIALWNRRLEQHPDLRRHLTVWDAISDLPPVPAGGGAEETGYQNAPETDYQRRVRGASLVLWDHQATPLPQVHLDLVRHVAEGQTWRDIPRELLPERFARIRRTDSTNLFARLDRTRPAYTITTQAYNVTTGCYTHPLQDRALTAREAARIQSFPDSFRFIGNLTSKFAQIGNAVPPLLAEAMGHAVRGHLGLESSAAVEPAQIELSLAI